MKLRLLAVLVLCTALLCSAQAAGATPLCSSPAWVGSWIASPSDASAQSLSDQTVRMIISPHLAGTVARVHLSNRFGHAPLSISHVTIGTAAAGGGIVPRTLRQLTFSGQRHVTIPAGADIVSDPVKTTILAFRKLAVSIAVHGTVQKPTEHSITREINYSTTAGSGDHTTDLTGRAFTASDGSHMSSGWYFLDGIDVRTTANTGAVVTFGDSITDGFQGRDSPVTEDFTTVGKEKRYPDFLQHRLDAAHIPLSVLNAGISGNRILKDGQIPSFGPRALKRLNADAIHQAGVRDVIILEGINDIGQGSPGNPTVQQMIDGYKQLIARLHAAHLRVLLGTLTPSGGTVIPGYGVTADQTRVPVNHWIRTQKLADGVIDFDAAVRDPSDPSRLNPAYDGSDHLHFSAAGYRALAKTVPLRKLATPTCLTALRVKASPRRLTAGRTTTIRVRVQANHRPVSHARVQLGNRVAYTNTHGTARLTIKLPKPGHYKLIITAHMATRTVIGITARKRPRTHRRR